MARGKNPLETDWDVQANKRIGEEKGQEEVKVREGLSQRCFFDGWQDRAACPSDCHHIRSSTSNLYFCAHTPKYGA